MNFLNVSAIIAFVAFSLLLDSCFAQKILFYGNSGIKKLDELNDISLRLSTEVDGLSISDKGVLFKLSEINPSELSPSAVQGLVKVVSAFYKRQGFENYDIELYLKAMKIKMDKAESLNKDVNSSLNDGFCNIFFKFKIK